MRRLSYLQGLRGLAALTVVVHHYFCAFYPVSVFGTGTSHGSWEHLFWVTPLGIIGSGNSPVCLFFILSGFVLSLPFFGSEAKETPDLLAAMVKRPVRLVGLVAGTMITSMVLLRSHLDYCAQLSTVTGSTWLTEYDIPLTSWVHFAKDLVTDPFGSGVVYNTPLWTISFELIGSYITFLFLLLFRRSQLKWLAYLIVGLQFIHSFYIGFIFGIFCADLWTTHSHRIAAIKGVWLLVVPLLLIGIYLASFESYLDAAYSRFTWHAFLPHTGHANIYPMLGAGAIFVSLLLSPKIQNFFSIGTFVYLGRISYAMYAIHLLVLRSVSSWIFLNLFLSHTYDERVIATFCASFLFILVIAHFVTVKFDEKVIKGANALAATWLKGNR
jgi:peptidoglycan/LPS O-acetylase OafA/YrhL